MSFFVTAIFHRPILNFMNLISFDFGLLVLSSSKFDFDYKRIIVFFNFLNLISFESGL